MFERAIAQRRALFSAIHSRPYTSEPRQNLIDATHQVRTFDPTIRCYGVVLMPDRVVVHSGAIFFLLLHFQDGTRYLVNLAPPQTTLAQGIEPYPCLMWRLKDNPDPPTDQDWFASALQGHAVARDYGHHFSAAQLVGRCTTKSDLLWSGDGLPLTGDD